MGIKTLIVGGNGKIGGRAAMRLREEGYDVTLAGRTPPHAQSPVQGFRFVNLDYLDDSLPVSTFEGFGAAVFCAGQDPRHVAGGEVTRYHDPEGLSAKYMMEANGTGVPRFFAKLRDAGVEVAINIGTLYPQATPHLLATSAYMRSRKASQDAVCAMARPGFRAMSLNPSWAMGAILGQHLSHPIFDRHMSYAAGLLPELPVFAPPGGTNLISTVAISDAILAAVKRGEGGQSYLLGDENVTYQQFFGAMFEEFGRPVPSIRDEPHPILSDDSITRGSNIWYEPDPADFDRLAWRRNDGLRAIREEMIPDFRLRHGLGSGKSRAR
jgi:dihydroflavonol-4-reductase